MRNELSDYEWAAIKPMLPNKQRGVRRANDRRKLASIRIWLRANGSTP
jgi:transposase